MTTVIACSGYQRRSMWPSMPVGAAEQQLAEIGHQPRQQRLAFRVAEADVVLQQLRAARRSASGRRRARPGRACLRRPCRRRSAGTISAIARSVSAGRHARRRRIGAHAAGVRAGVALADALVVLRGAERQHARPVDQGEQARLLADQAVLDHHGRCRPRRTRRRTPASRAASASSTVRRDRDPLAGGEPVRLDHDRRAVRADVGPGGLRLARAVNVRNGAVGMPWRPQNSLANALEPSRRAAAGARAERRMPAASSRSTRPSTSGSSGPGTTSSMPSLAAEGDDAGEIVDRERHAGRLARDRIAARRAVQLDRPAAMRRAPSRAHARVRPRPRPGPSCRRPDVIAPSGL